MGKYFIDEIYRKSQDNIIASYSGIDIATGAGNGIFYLANAIGPAYFLTTSSSVYSDDTSINNNGAALDLDFDATIGSPFEVKGSAVLSLMVLCNGGNDTTPDIDVQIIKYDGTTESTLASSSGGELQATDTFKVYTWKLTIAKTAFKIGDTLRVSIQIAAAPSAFSVTNLYIDPSNRDTTATILSTASSVAMPILVKQ